MLENEFFSGSLVLRKCVCVCVSVYLRNKNIINGAPEIYLFSERKQNKHKGNVLVRVNAQVINLIF